MSELPQGPATQVEVIAKRGPRFYRREDGVVMFEFVNDGTSKVSHPATIDDRKNYPEAWRAFEVPPDEDLQDAPAAVAGPVEISAHWQDMHFEDRKALAGKIAGREVTTAAEANMIIRSEVERREAEEDAGDQV